MCRLVQINVYHYCTHTQRVIVPSLDPNCTNRVLGREYLMNEWCPRCRWSSFLVPYEYTEVAKAVRCGPIGDVTRTVNFDPEEFKKTKTYVKEQLWEIRDDYLHNRMPLIRQELRLQEFERVAQREVADGLAHRDRTYFMEEFRESDPDFNRCPELFLPTNDVPEDRDVCEVCKGRLAEPTSGKDNRDPCFSGSAVVELPCDHFFGLYCISGWMENPRTPTCPTCRQAYKIIHELSFSELTILPPGYEEQREVDFAPDSLIRGLHIRLMIFYYLKILLAALWFTPFFFSLTNLFMLTVGAILFYRSIPLIQVQPRFALRERQIQNRFALFSALANSIEVVFYGIISGPRYTLWLYPCLSCVLAAGILSASKPLLRRLYQFENCPDIIKAIINVLL